jgi:hypothetical protein
MFLEDAHVKCSSYYGLGNKNLYKSCSDDGMQLNSATLKYLDRIITFVFY